MNKGKICVSVCAETAAELVGQIKSAGDLADIVEIRFDCLTDAELRKTKFKLPEFKRTFLVTFRPREQGGRRDLSVYERLKFWEAIFWSNRQKNFLVDTEFDIKETINVRAGKTIVSYHDFAGEVEKLPFIYEILTSTEQNILKIAVQAKDITDTIPVWKLLEKAKSENQQIIPIAMGESGKWTRILGLAHGAPMTYAALDSGRETAPGQISAKDLIEVYRVKELDEKTEIYGIIGGNTSYSMSPYIHNAAFKFHKLNAVFVPLQTKNLDEFFKRMVKPETREIELNFKGFAVTIPHKQNIIKHLDFLDDAAEKIGAVNTVKIENGKFYGYNTDAHGFIEPLKNTYGDLKNAKVAVFGAGGAARACIYALKKEGAKVTVFARNIEKAKNLAEEFQVELKTLSTQHSALSTFDVVVNSTPLGTKGELEAETPATAGQIKNVQLVYDLVYNPFETRFLREAKSVDVPTIGGLAMLIAQAMRQQKIWTGFDAPMKEMSRAALRKLQS
jgi:3-dehydroquinate dehydratase / shikimate dehydrogenase